MKHFFPSCALFIAVTSSIAQAATGDSGTLNITAQLSAPICSFAVTGDGQNAGTNTVDFGKIDPLTLNQDSGGSTLVSSSGSPRFATATVLCDAKTNVTINFKDANSNASSNINLNTTPTLATLFNLLQEPISFALMMDDTSTPVGRFGLNAVSSQTMAAFGDNTNDLTAARILLNGVSTNANNTFEIKKTDTLTFSKDGATPAPLKKLLLKMQVTALIVKDAIATADQVNISGQAIVNVKYL